MTVRTILQWPHPKLSQRSEDVPPGLVSRELVQDLFDTMYAAPGRGLAAPQIGVMQRVFVMDAGWKHGDPTPMVIVNPRILERASETVNAVEGCLSIPGLVPLVPRAARVRMRWTDAEGAGHDDWLEGFDARCVQHEIDHLDGLVFLDRLPADVRARMEEQYRSGAV